MFTDTTGQDAGWNGAGQFVLRSPDPTFATGVETLASAGYWAETDAGSRFHSVVDAFSADLMWVDALNAFAIAHETDEGTTITFWDKDFGVTPYRPIVVAGPWREGPGLVRRSDGHAIVPPDAACDTVPIDLVRGTRQGRDGPTDLMHFGIDVVQAEGCHTTTRALNALIGFAMPSPVRTIDLIVAGKLIRIDRRSVAEALGFRFLDRRLPVLDGAIPDAELTAGLPAVRAPGRGIGLVMAGKLWLLPSPAVAERNSSPVKDISAAAWDLYQRGPDLLAPPG
jgi:hypothetical protein